MVSFLTKERSSRDITALITQLSECQCSSSSELVRLYDLRVYHELGQRAVADFKYKIPANLLVVSIFAIMTKILCETGGIRVAKGQGAKRWPTCISDVIPFGAEMTVQSVGQWLVLLPDPSACSYLKESLRLCEGLVFAAITNSQSFLQRFIVAFRGECIRLRQPRRHKRIQSHITIIARFVYQITESALAAPSRTIVTDWARGHENEVLTTLSDAIYLCRDEELSPIQSEDDANNRDVNVTSFYVFGSLCSLNDDRRPPGLHPHLMKSHGGPTTQMHKAQHVVCFIQGFRKSRHCHGCSISLPEVGTTFQKCSACAVAVYCSTACQAADWTHSQYPHKVYCQKIQTFVAAGGGLEKLGWKHAGSMEFLRDFDHQAAGDTMLELYDWGLGRAPSRAEAAATEEFLSEHHKRLEIISECEERHRLLREESEDTEGDGNAEGDEDTEGYDSVDTDSTT